MVRVGRSPAKKIPLKAETRDVTAMTIVYIPELSTYWEQGLEVLQVCLNSLRKSAGRPFDLMVFDNGSCREVKSYLAGLLRAGDLQYLFQADENVGKAAAMNMLFAAAPGRYLAYTDSDVLFLPGWLEESIRVFETFDGVGMVSGRPWRPLDGGEIALYHANAVLAEGMPGVQVERGNLVERSVLEEHYASIGEDDGTLDAPEGEDFRITRNGVSAYGFGSHFQFVTTKEIASRVGPLPAGTMGLGLAAGVRRWDERISEMGCLRLALSTPMVRHLGNTLEGEDPRQLESLAGPAVTEKVTKGPRSLPWLARLFYGLARFGILWKILNRIQVSIYAALHHRPR
jgi:hypothetical protein